MIMKMWHSRIVLLFVGAILISTVCCDVLLNSGSQQPSGVPNESADKVKTHLPIGGHRVYRRTKFTCRGRTSGYYADIDTGCQVYHMCDGLGRQFSYACPNATLFQQRMLICDHWYMVVCQDSERNYDANLLIGQRDKPFVTDSENRLRTPRPDLSDHPYAHDYSGESFRQQYNKNYESAYQNSIDANVDQTKINVNIKTSTGGFDYAEASTINPVVHPSKPFTIHVSEESRNLPLLNRRMDLAVQVGTKSNFGNHVADGSAEVLRVSASQDGKRTENEHNFENNEKNNGKSDDDNETDADIEGDEEYDDEEEENVTEAIKHTKIIDKPIQVPEIIKEIPPFVNRPSKFYSPPLVDPNYKKIDEDDAKNGTYTTKNSRYTTIDEGSTLPILSSTKTTQPITTVTTPKTTVSTTPSTTVTTTIRTTTRQSTTPSTTRQSTTPSTTTQSTTPSTTTQSTTPSTTRHSTVTRSPETSLSTAAIKTTQSDTSSVSSSLSTRYSSPPTTATTPLNQPTASKRFTTITLPIPVPVTSLQPPLASSSLFNSADNSVAASNIPKKSSHNDYDFSRYIKKDSTVLTSTSSTPITIPTSTTPILTTKSKTNIISFGTAINSQAAKKVPEASPQILTAPPQPPFKSLPPVPDHINLPAKDLQPPHLQLHLQPPILVKPSSLATEFKAPVQAPSLSQLLPLPHLPPLPALKEKARPFAAPITQAPTTTTTRQSTTIAPPTTLGVLSPKVSPPPNDLLPPHEKMAHHDDATTVGPPIYFEWKIPSNGLEPPKLDSTIKLPNDQVNINKIKLPTTVRKPATDLEPPVLEYAHTRIEEPNKPLQAASPPIKAISNQENKNKITPVTEPAKDLLPPINPGSTTSQLNSVNESPIEVANDPYANNPFLASLTQIAKANPTPQTHPKAPTPRSISSEFTSANINTDFIRNINDKRIDYTDLKKKYSIPEYIFPLEGDTKAREQYGTIERRNSFQIKIPDRNGENQWYGENSKCPECHPSFVKPGTCEPCVKIR